MGRKRHKFFKRFPQPLHGVDFYLVVFVLAVLAFGLVMVLSAGAVKGYSVTQNSFYYVLRQFRWAALGAVVAFIMTRIPYYFLRKFAGIGIIVSIVLLSAVLFTDSGETAGGAARWLDLGPITIQPSEVVKVALVLFLAHFCARKPIKSLKDAMPLGIVLVPIYYLVYEQPDLGTTMLLVFTTAAILWQTELPTKWFGIAIPTFGIPLAFLIYNKPYQWKRILAWWDPWKYMSDSGLQGVNAQIAFGSGGIFGVGLGNSMQKFGFLPETYTDMIFAIIGEELGLIGTIFLVSLLILLYGRAFFISSRCKDLFGRLLAFGITFSLACQTCMNLAVVTGVMPITGITLPLVSYGGSSLVITLMEIGILLNISRYVDTKVSRPQRQRTIQSHGSVHTLGD